MAICLYDKIKIPPQIAQIDTPNIKQWSSMEITGDNLRSLWRKSFLPRLFAILYSAMH